MNEISYEAESNLVVHQSTKVTMLPNTNLLHSQGKKAIKAIVQKAPFV
jgi:hypothetical protein